MTKRTKRTTPARTRTNRKVPTRAAKLVALCAKIAAINEECIGDHERSHRLVDEALLDYIGDAEVSKLFDAVSRWYA